MTKVMDCTLRDGGYYVDWDFDESTVKKYLAAVALAKVDVIEIGFRFLPANKFLGAFAYSTDEYLSSINLPSAIPIAVMINASDLINYEHGIGAAINQLFTAKCDSVVDIVRIATRAKDISSCREIAEKINNLGYRVFLNLMQVDAVNSDDLIKISNQISNWNIIEALYFADSFGSMEPDFVKQIIGTIRQGWSGSLGIHAHDNKGMALSNSMAAHEAGIHYIDATLCGMGRGAGNAKTEYLLVEMMQHSLGEYFPDALFPLVLHEFKELQQKYQWGSNIYYYLSATYGIHPTYIQEMLGDDRYDTDQVLAAINFLKSSKAPSFSFENMLRASAGTEGNEHGAWSAKNWLTDKTVLILGAGPSTKKYIEAIQLYVTRHKPVVLCLNVNEAVPVDLVDAYVACHEVRILIESDSYSSLGKPIIMPLSRVPTSIHEALQESEILDYGLRISEGSFDIAYDGCVLSAPLALTYAVSIATAGGADKILRAGVDGYGGSDLRQLEMIKMMKQYESKPDSISLLAITPTTYPIQKRSIFEPEI